MDRRAARSFTMIGALALPVIPLLAYFWGNWYSLLHDYSLGMVCGIVAYCYFAITLVLAARLRWLDHLFGQDRVLIMHARMAATAWVLLLGHIGLKASYASLASTQIRLGVVATLLFGLLMLVTLLFMRAGPLVRFAPFAAAQRGIQRIFNPDYSRVKLFHNLLAMAFMFAAVHVGLAISTTENRIRVGLMGAIGIGAVLVYGYHKGIRPVIAYLGGHRVSRVLPLSPAITALEIAGRLPRFNAGQFCYLRILSRTSGIEEHPFTISSAPHHDLIRFTIKQLGDYTERLPGVMPGSRILLDGPYGRFTPRCNTVPQLWVAGGIGITPFLSIAADWDRQGIRQPTVLLWSVRDRKDMIDDGLFASVATRHAAFRFEPVITGIPAPDGSRQRINRIRLAALCCTIPPAGSQAYVCGPVSMIDDVILNLRSLGWPRHAIHSEKFTS